MDPGATATDNVDGDITADIVIDDSAVDTSTLGTYRVTFNVSDAAGNAAEEVIRNVTVVAPENNAPVAQDDNFTIAENEILNTGVFNNNGNGIDQDADNDPIIVDLVNSSTVNVGNPVNGTQGGRFTIDAGGNLNFNPNGEFDGLDAGEEIQTTVTYRITDSNDGFDTATVMVTVTGVDDPNVAPTADAGTAQSITLPANTVNLERFR